MTTGEPVRAWGDCPTCEGTGDASGNTAYFPCPTCAAFHAAVDAAKREGAREAYNRVWRESDGVGKCPWHGVEDHGVTANFSAQFWCEVSLTAMEQTSAAGPGDAQGRTTT